MLKRRGRGQPATAAVRNEPLTNAMDTQELASSPHQHLASGSGPREEQAGKERLFGQLVSFFSLVVFSFYFSDTNRYLPFGCTSC